MPNRQNVYRGRDRDKAAGRWVFGSALTTSDRQHTYIVNADLAGTLHKTEVEPETVEQMLWIGDCNHDPIFEDDILSGDLGQGVVRWDKDKQRFCIDFSGDTVSFDAIRTWDYMIVGNIHDNSDEAEENA